MTQSTFAVGGFDIHGKSTRKTACVPLAWILGCQCITSTLMCVSRVEQVAGDIVALDMQLLPEHSAALDAVSKPDIRMLYSLFTPALRQHAVFGGNLLKSWRSQHQCRSNF